MPCAGKASHVARLPHDEQFCPETLGGSPREGRHDAEELDEGIHGLADLLGAGLRPDRKHHRRRGPEEILVEPPVATPASHDDASFLARATVPAPDNALYVGLDGKVLKYDGRRPLGRLPSKTRDENRRVVIGIPCDVISLVSRDRLRRKSDDIVADRRKSRNRIEEPHKIGDRLYSCGPPCG